MEKWEDNKKLSSHALREEYDGLLIELACEDTRIEEGFIVDLKNEYYLMYSKEWEENNNADLKE